VLNLWVFAMSISFRTFTQKLALLTSIVLPPAVHAQGEWLSHAVKGEEEASHVATRKYEKYNAISAKNIQDIEAYAAKHCPEVNADMLSEGLTRFFNDKQTKWQSRSTLRGRAAVNEALKVMSSKALYNFESETPEEWRKVLTEASQNHASLYFQSEALKGLDVVKAKAMNNLTQGLDNAEIEKHAFTLGYVAKILQTMNIDHEIERFKKLHTHLNQKLLNLMGIEPDQLQQNFQTVLPAVAIIDVEFKKNIVGDTKPYAIDRQPSFTTWKKGDSVNHEATDWGHGDLINALIGTVSPKATLHRYYESTETSDYDAFGQNVVDHYAKISSPVIFNCSFIPSGNHYFLTAGDRGIRLDSTVDDGLKQPNFFESLKQTLGDKFPEKDVTSLLDEEQLAFLKEKENENMKSKNAPESAKTLVQGPNKDQTHLIVASPTNNPGPLVREGYHNARIKLLDEKETQDHALVALNFDFTAGNLCEKSHSAGEYKHMAVVVPATFVSVMEEGNSLPYITYGGHSSATALLSGFSSHIRGHYPELDHLEVRKAILESANRSYPGYNETEHGQGMLNLKGALQRAKEIAEEKKE
jgi:hypothetical protein